VSERPPKICVLGEDDRAFLAVVRSFGRRGAEVHLCWTPPDALARRSRYVVRVHDEVPRHAPGDEAWLPAFVELLERERFDLVVPTNDASILPLERHRRVLEPHGPIALVSERAFAVCHDKERTYALAESLGIPLPRQQVLALPAAPDAIDAAWYPLVLKPRSSFTLDDLRRKRAVRLVPRPDALAAGLAAFAGAADVLVQQQVPGVGAGIEVLAVGGEVLAALQHVRLHERKQGGLGSYRMTVPLQSDMYEAVARLVRALDYTGVGMFEFKLDRETGVWALIEVNARFWGSLPLCLHAGADFPWWLYEALACGRREFPKDYRLGVYARNWRADLAWLADNFREASGSRLPLATLARELGPLVRGREASDTFTLDDPGPGLEDVRRLGARVLRRAGRAARELAEHLPGVRACRAARARRALARAGEVLFVCKGNVCRSPFAEAYLGARLDGTPVRVRSAGYLPKPDRPCPAEAQAAARELGTDLSTHRSRTLDAEMVRSADAIFTFDEQNYATVVARHPEARDKVHRLAVPDIRDPYGGTLDEFRRTYDRIRRALDAALGER
jgi:protein-tyrosine-phosphatase/predicted ATP-grasp superfamily ATP-dependent carboligase